MAEPTQITFTHKEVATALLKQQGIHDGIWGLHVQFGLGAMNVGNNKEDINPAAIIPVVSIGLQKFEEENNLSVDAAKANPKTSGAKKKSTK